MASLNISTTGESNLFLEQRGYSSWRIVNSYNNLHFQRKVGDDYDQTCVMLATGPIEFSKTIVAPIFQGNLDWNYLTSMPTTFPPSAHSHNNLTSDNSLSALPALNDYEFKFYSAVNWSVPEIFSVNNNANAIFSINTHPGSFGWNIGLSGNGNIYTRWINGGNWSGWRTMLHSDNWSTWCASKSHAHSELNMVHDTRDEATTPATYFDGLCPFRFYGLKQRTTIGTPGTATYAYLLGLAGWDDNSGGDAYELAFQSNDGIFARHGKSSWGDWEQLLTSKNWTNSISISSFYHAISSGEDFNNFATPGWYSTNLTDIMLSCSNRPFDAAGCVEVLQHAGYHQRAIEYYPDVPKIYFRNFYSGTWGPWHRIYSTCDKPTCADIGALPLSGGQLTGALRFNSTSYGSTLPSSGSTGQVFFKLI